VYTVYPVIFTSGTTPGKLTDLKDLDGRTISISKGYKWATNLLASFGNRVNIIEADTPVDALKLLYEGKVDYMLGHSQNAYFISAHQLLGLHPALILMDRPIHAVMGIREDLPLLASIIDKGLTSISKKERTEIYNRWAQLPQQKETIALTQEERAWLAQNHTVRVSSGNFPPFIIRQGQAVSGIVIDYLRLISDRTGITFEYVEPGIPFADYLEGVKAISGPVDLISCMMRTPKRETYLSFSKDYLNTPRMIFTRKNTGIISGLADFVGKKIAVPRQTVVQQEIMAKYPGIQLLLFDRDEDALEAVSNGKADGYVGNLVGGSYLILQHGFVNLTVAAPTDLKNHIFSFGSRKDWPHLSSILDKGMDTITPEEKLAIRSKYLSIRYDHGIRPADLVKWILIVAGAGSAILLLFVFWNRSLKQQVSARTLELMVMNTSLSDEVEERKQAEARLRYQATLLKNISDAVISSDLDFRIISWNEAAHEIYGWKAEEIMGKKLRDVLQTQQSDIKQKEMLVAVRHRGKWISEVKQVKKNGMPIDIHTTVSRVTDDQGNMIGFVGIHRDITQQKKSQKLLIDSENRFRATFEQAAVGIAHVGIDGNFLRVNEKFCDILGYSKEETQTLTFQDITHPDDLATDLDHLDQLLKGGKKGYSMEKRYVRKDSGVVWANLTVSLLREDTGKPLFFVSVIKDISARKQLQEERDRILTLSPDLICIATMEGSFIYLNPAWEKTLGYTQEEILARPRFDLIHPDDHLKNDNEVEKLATGKQTKGFENRYCHKNGSIRHISWVATPLVEKKLIYCIGRDITDRKKADEKIYEYQERLKALSSQLTIIEEKERKRIATELHDNIGQTLAFSRIQVAKIKKHIPQQSQVATLLDDLSQSLFDTLRDTKDLIFDLSSPLLNELGLGAAIGQWLQEQVLKKHGIQTAFINDQKPPLVNSDLKAILFRNVRELIANAIKHAHATKIIVSMTCPGDDLIISVSDDGIGFDSDTETISVTSHSQFGLFSIKERVEAFKGSFKIISAPGKGTTAIMTVPLMRPMAKTREQNFA
jgi:PAS domain S-box-containing protein